MIIIDHILPRGRCMALALVLCLWHVALMAAPEDGALPVPDIRAAIEKEVQAIGAMILEQGIRPTEVFPLLHQFLAEHPGIYGSAMAYAPDVADDAGSRSCPYVFRQGRSLVEKNLADKDYDYTRWNWYTVPRDSRAALWSEPYLDEGGGGVMMTTYSMPLFQNGGNGVFFGVFTADLVLE